MSESRTLRDGDGIERLFEVGAYVMARPWIRAKVTGFLRDDSLVCVTCDLRDSGTKFVADSSSLLREVDLEEMALCHRSGLVAVG